MSTALEQLSDLQDRINAWCAEQFPEQTPLTILSHLEEETQELGDRHTAEEAADCLILLLVYAAHTGQPLLDRFTLTDWEGDLGSSAGELLHCAERRQEHLGELRYYLAFLLAWSVLAGHDILAAAEAKHAVNLTRQWRRGDDGIHRHVEGQP
jgi:NTP pyrophosphatase (non-canonical NTP hydrolase)